MTIADRGATPESAQGDGILLQLRDVHFRGPA